LFNDVFSCPRCQTIVVVKDHVTMTWSGSKALVLLDEFEKYITQRLLECRGDAVTVTAKSEPVDRHAPYVVKAAPLPVANLQDADPSKLRECDQCNSIMKVGCGAVCPSCKWVAPCTF